MYKDAKKYQLLDAESFLQLTFQSVLLPNSHNNSLTHVIIHCLDDILFKGDI